KPETSTNFELGAIYDSNSGFMIGVTAFHNDFKDKISSGNDIPNCSWEENPNRPGCVDHGYWPNLNYFSQTLNVDKATTQGFELTTAFDITDALSLTDNYTFLDTDLKSGPDKVNTLSDSSKTEINVQLH